MNRRDFNTSLAALFALPALPAASVTTATARAFPPATYLWADLIARSRGHVDAGFLARRLGLSADMADELLAQLVTDGVVNTPGLTGLAKASNPIRFDAPAPKLARRTMSDVKTRLNQTLRKLDEQVPESESAEPARNGEDSGT